MLDQSFIFQLTTAAFYITSLLFLFLISITGLFFFSNKQAFQRLSLLRPSIIELLQGSTDENAATIKVPNLVGELMDVDVPLYRIEKIRREAVNYVGPKYLLWLSVLVCAAYQDVKSFRDEIVELMKKDMESSGQYEHAENLASLCKYPISVYPLFKIITCMLNENLSYPGLKSFFDEIREYASNHNISQDVTAISRFKVILRSIKYTGLVMIGLFISAVLYFSGSSIPELILWLLLLAVSAIMVLTLLVIIRIAKQLVKPISCEDIEADITADIPRFGIHI